ncbi:forkhead box c2 [Pyrrhoderma noxium]|uniref:Forkhead box c2 n=1 Tax=Pyrrhoderma noxium TaxID=2282107 RepID=A0A286UNB4_9AGAM|nr:forkhead box c2 [Pyrrhoderma noxium]
MAQQPTPTLHPEALLAAQASELASSSYYPEPPSDLTGGLPINLDSLRDGPPGSKPFYPYSTLIRYAIKGSPTQKLLLEDIYYAIESRFPYFRTAPSGWKNSVRHNLSLNPCFEKVPRPLTDRGKGSYWTVNDNVDPRTGVHRIRKKRSHKAKSVHSDEHDTDYPLPEETNAAPPPTTSTAGFEQPQVYEQPAVVQPDPTAPPVIYMPAIPQMPEVDENGNVNWRSAWMNELAKLQHITAEQDKLQAEPEWYREMLFRVRTAMMAPIDQNGVLQMGAVPMAAPPPPPQEVVEQQSQ